VLFVDADTWYKPEFIPSLLAFAHKGDIPILSCFLRQERVTLIEKIMLPYAFALYFCGVSGKRVNSLKYPRCAGQRSVLSHPPGAPTSLPGGTAPS